MKVADIYKRPEKKNKRLLFFSPPGQEVCEHKEQKAQIHKLKEKIEELRSGPYFNPLPNRIEIKSLGLSRNAFFKLEE